MKLKANSDPLYAITPSNGWTESGIVNGRICLYFYIPEDEEQNTYFNIGSTGDPSSWGWIYQFYFYKKAGTDIYSNLNTPFQFSFWTL